MLKDVDWPGAASRADREQIFNIQLVGNSAEKESTRRASEVEERNQLRHSGGNADQSASHGTSI